MTGEMSRADVTRDAFPLHFAIADAFGGTVEPFDVYQGPYVRTKGGARLWVNYDNEGVFATIFNETTRQEFEAFITTDGEDSQDWAVNCARTVTEA